MPRITASDLVRSVLAGAAWPPYAHAGATALPALLHLTPQGQPTPAGATPTRTSLDGTLAPGCPPCPPSAAPCPPPQPCPPPTVQTVQVPVYQSCPPCPSPDTLAAPPAGGGPLSGCWPWWLVAIAFATGGVAGYVLGRPEDCTKKDPKDPGKNKGGKVDWCGCDPRTVPPEAKPKVSQCKPKDQERADKKRAEEARKRALKEGKPALPAPIEVRGLKPAA